MSRDLKSEGRKPKTEGNPISEVRIGVGRRMRTQTPGFGIRLVFGTGVSAVSLLWLLAIGAWLPVLSAAETSLNTAQPFLRLRESKLGDHGPDEDLTGLTGYRIG